MSPRRIARVELALRRIVPTPSWRRRVGRAESTAPSCPRPDRTTTSNTFQVTNTRFAKSLMAAWHQREASFALRYQTHLTVVRLSGVSRVDGRGAGVSACLVIVRYFGRPIQIAAVVPAPYEGAK